MKHLIFLAIFSFVTTTVMAAEKHVTLLHLADTHAQLESHPEYVPGGKPEIQTMGGYARLKTAIDRVRAETKHATFVADGGDTFQGSGPAAWTEGEVVLAPFNALGVDVAVPGNWEVVYGPKRFLELMRQVSARVLAYNFHDSKSGRRLFAPHVTMTRDGVKVTFVGITDPTATTRQPPDQVRGLDSTRMDGLREHVQRIRSEEKPELIVAVTHTGLALSRQLAREIPEFDVILSGHTHERTGDPIREGNVLIVEPGSMGSFLGRLDLTIKDGRVAAHSFRLLPIRAADYSEDAQVKKLVNAALAPHRVRANRVVAKSETTLQRYDVLETTTDNFIADVVREETGADIAFSNGFRFGPPILPGDVTEGDLWTMLPLDSRMKLGWVTGKQLREYLERELELVFSDDAWTLSGGWGPRPSGLTFTYRAKASAGKRVVSVKVKGREIRDEDRFTIAGCERAGEPMDMICRLRGTHDARVVGPSVHEALLSYLKKSPTIRAQREGRAVALDLEPAVFSQDEVLRAKNKEAK